MGVQGRQSIPDVLYRAGAAARGCQGLGHSEGTFAGQLQREELPLDADFWSEKLVLRCSLQTFHTALHSLPGPPDLPI